MIRLILAGLFLLFALLYGFVLNFFIWIVRFRDPLKADRMVFRFLKFCSKAVIALSGTKVEVRGIENLPLEGPVVYMLNHWSIFDVLITLKYVNTPMGFVAKQSLESIPVLSHWMRLCHCVFLNRGDLKDGARVVHDSVENLKAGVSMGIFPEGTRNRSREDRVSFLPFKTGSAKLATRTDLPVTPIVLYYPEPCFEEHSPFLKKNHVKVAFGKPVTVAGLSPEEKRFLSDRVQSQMESMMKELV